MGGPPRVVQAISERLQERGHDVSVLTVNYGDSLGPGSNGVGDVDVVYLRPFYRYRTFTLAPGVIPYCVNRLREFDLVHIYGLYELLGPSVAMFCRRWAIPYLVEPLGMNRPMLRNVPFKRVYQRVLGRRLLGRASRVIATSDHERSMLEEDGVPAGNISVRRNGVDLAEFDSLPPRGSFRERNGIRPDDKVILFVGRLASVKSLELVLEAMAKLPDASVRLVMAGPEESDGYRQFLEETAADLQIGARLLFTGPMYGRDKLEALVDADVFVLPSRSENFGNAAVEAMACSRPVIVTEGCGVAPYVGGKAGLVVRHDADDLKGALEAILGDDELAKRYASEGPAVARQLSWDEPVSQMETLYREIVEAGS